MRTKRWLVGGMCLITTACSASSSTDESTDESELRTKERGFEYSCAVTGDASFIPKATTRLVITDGHLQFDGDYGPNLGARDRAYKPRTGAKVRYDGFSTGDDCTMKVVADSPLVTGQPKGALRIQCAGDDFRQDVLTCTGPKATTLKLPKPAAPVPPAPSGGTVPAATTKWSCVTKSENPMLETRVTLQVTDAAIRVEASGTEYTGTRDRTYRSRSGNLMSYENVEYGGDCTMTLLVDANALTSSTTTTTLKARCSGDGFQEDAYICASK